MLSVLHYLFALILFRLAIWHAGVLDYIVSMGDSPGAVSFGPSRAMAFGIARGPASLSDGFRSCSLPYNLFDVVIAVFAATRQHLCKASQSLPAEALAAVPSGYNGTTQHGFQLVNLAFLATPGPGQFYAACRAKRVHHTSALRKNHVLAEQSADKAGWPPLTP